MPNGRPRNPIYAVKIENTAAGAPQTGLESADLIVEELVEGGLTRLAAFYWSTLPTSVGHVRSMRTSDVGIVAPTRAHLVATGGAPQVYGVVEGAGLTVHAEDRGAPGFRSDPDKQRPYNRLVDLRALNAEVAPDGVRQARDVADYLPWAPVSPDSASVDPTADDVLSGGRVVSTAAATFSGASTTRWGFADGVWRRTNGHASKEFGAKNLVVLSVPIGDAGYRDPAGNPVPATTFEGRGFGWVLQGDEAFEVRWSKARLGSPIVLTDSSGAEVRVAPGRTWVALVPQAGGSVQVR